MHDVGRLALTVVESLQYSNLLLAAEENALDILDEERKLFGMDHCQAGTGWLSSGSCRSSSPKSPRTAMIARCQPSLTCCR
jgi:hypothetical protein